MLALALVIVVGSAGGLFYWGKAAEERERQALEKIGLLSDQQNSIGRSYARTLSGIESLRAEFRMLVDSHPDVPTGQLRALADETTLKVIRSQGLAGDVDLVVDYVADLDACIAAGNCDPKVATGNDSPLAALRNWEQWYRPYLEASHNVGAERETAFYRYLGRRPA
jgi:hypothetical protein